MSARNRTALRRVHFFRRQPRCVFERLPNVAFLEIRMIPKHFLDGGTVSNLSNDHRHGDSHAANTCATAHDFRVECDALEHDFDSLEHHTFLRSTRCRKSSF